MMHSTWRHSDLLGIPRTRSFDVNLFDIRQVSADKIAVSNTKKKFLIIFLY